MSLRRSFFLQGEEGSDVQLRVRSFRGGKERLVSLTRRQIRINPVSYALCSPASASVGGGSEGSRVGYIRLATFNKNTADATRDALLDLKERPRSQNCRPPPPPPSAPLGFRV